MQALKWLGVELVEVSLKEKLVSTLGSAAAIYLAFIITGFVLPPTSAVGVVASMGATAVLLFAVPHGQLSQPWPVVGGHVTSAIIGVACAQLVTSPTLATALAVGVSIGVMHQLKCIHPPGGATAFTAVMGGHAIHDLGFTYVLIPVGLNAIAMLGFACIFNYPFLWRRYPAVLVKRGADATGEDLVISDDEHHRFLESLRSLDSFVDVSEEDLVYLSRTMAQLAHANPPVRKLSAEFPPSS